MAAASLVSHSTGPTAYTHAVPASSPTAAGSPYSATSPNNTLAPLSAGIQPQLAIKLSREPPPVLSLQPPPLSVAAAPINKMAMSSVVSSMPPSPAKPPASLTSKEWVIPPRPKPGRKPATDTPPTKRKAQNRAAQRAFRERRAARVGELEEQLDEQRAEHEGVERELREKIRSLEMETQTLKTRCQVLENVLERERMERARVSGQQWNADAQPRNNSLPSSIPISLASPTPAHPQTQQAQRYSGGSNNNNSPGNNASSDRRSSTAQPFSISQIISPPDETPVLTCGSCKPEGPCACANEILAAAGAGCGKCTLGSRCGCLEESMARLDAAAASATTTTTTNAAVASTPLDLKRPHSPGSPSSLAPNEKRIRADVQMETDFTATFAQTKQRQRQQQQQHVPARPGNTTTSQLSATSPPTHDVAAIDSGGAIKDKCGFCGDGTYCVCADALSETTATLPTSNDPVAQQQQTPPPSETDCVPHPMEVTATGAIKLPTLQSSQQRKKNNKPLERPAAERPPPATSSSSCGPNGPGTCAQCIADPKAGLFCRSLAANFERQGRGSGGGGGCCGAGGPGGGCCKDASSKQTKPADADTLGLSLSCADAYKTLASHRHFDEATDEIGTWLPLLKAAPRRDPDATPSRHPMEVEAASIMSVLKGFDVRFGR